MIAAVTGFSPDTFLFDLDGTLIDSVPDITLAIADLMHSEGLAPFSETAVRDMVGYGVATLVERAFAARGLPIAGELKTAKVAKMMEIYPHHLTGRSTLMPGVIDALDFLKRGAGKLAVVTNKPQLAAETVLHHFGIARYFAIIVGDRPLDPDRLAPKPKPDMLLFALDRLGGTRERAVMIGDSAADMQSAAAAGVFSIAVRNGYSIEPIDSYAPGLSIADLTRLPEALDSLA